MPASPRPMASSQVPRWSSCMSNRWLALLVVASCTVDENAYENQVFTCDVTSGDMTACGSGYTCYGAVSALGAPDFCAPDCETGSPPSGFLCNDNAGLQKCSPAG